MSENITISGDGASIELEVLSYERPQGSEKDDANWMCCSLAVRVGPFSCRTRLSLTTFELGRFAEDLEGLLAEDAGTASLDTIEEVVQCTITSTGNGKAAVESRVHSLGSARADLTFSFDSDQGYLKRTASEIRAALTTFPER